MWIEKQDAKGKTHINLVKANMIWVATGDDDKQNYGAEPGDVVVWFEQYGAIVIRDVATKCEISAYLAQNKEGVRSRLEAAKLDTAREISKTIMDIAEETERIRRHLERTLGDEPTSACYSPPKCQDCGEDMEEAVLHDAGGRELAKIWVCNDNPLHQLVRRS